MGEGFRDVEPLYIKRNGCRIERDARAANNQRGDAPTPTKEKDLPGNVDQVRGWSSPRESIGLKSRGFLPSWRKGEHNTESQEEESSRGEEVSWV